MRIAPVSVTQHKSQSFGTLQFELDQPSKQLYYDMCKSKGFNEASVVDNIGALKKTLSEMAEKTDKQIQWYLNQNPATQNLLAHDVWPEKTSVPISIKRVKVDENNEDLIATIAGRHSVIADNVETLRPYTPNRKYNEIDYRSLLYRLPKDSFILDELIIPEVNKKPLYVEAINKFADRELMDPEDKAEDLSMDINEWLG